MSCKMHIIQFKSSSYIQKVMSQLRLSSSGKMNLVLGSLCKLCLSFLQLEYLETSVAFGFWLNFSGISCTDSLNMSKYSSATCLFYSSRSWKLFEELFLLMLSSLSWYFRLRSTSFLMTGYLLSRSVSMLF